MMKNISLVLEPFSQSIPSITKVSRQIAIGFLAFRLIHQVVEQLFPQSSDRSKKIVKGFCTLSLTLLLPNTNFSLAGLVVASILGRVFHKFSNVHQPSHSQSNTQNNIPPAKPLTREECIQVLTGWLNEKKQRHTPEGVEWAIDAVFHVQKASKNIQTYDVKALQSFMNVAIQRHGEVSLLTVKVLTKELFVSVNKNDPSQGQKAFDLIQDHIAIYQKNLRFSEVKAALLLLSNTSGSETKEEYVKKVYSVLPSSERHPLTPWSESIEFAVDVAFIAKKTFPKTEFNEYLFAIHLILGAAKLGGITKHHITLVLQRLIDKRHNALLALAINRDVPGAVKVPL